MAYLHIENLYKAQAILMFNKCYALEKIHGTSAHVSYKDERVALFAGGGKHEVFIQLFDTDALVKSIVKIISPNKSVHIYGEFYGGKLQGMSKTYGDKQRFIAFEVKIGDTWLNVVKAHAFVADVGLEFVHYVEIPTTLEAIDAQRDAPSEQANRNGVGNSTDAYGFCPPIREGIVLRPIEEVTLNNGSRVIAKHKRHEFSETKTQREVNPERVKSLKDAQEVADEWVTEQRLNHVLDSGRFELVIERTGDVVRAMIEDVLREGESEVVDSPEVRKQIGKRTSTLFRGRMKF